MASENTIAAMKQRIWTSLRSPSITSISFEGWDGIGKTILMRQIKEELQKQQEQEHGGEEAVPNNLFDKVVWITVSQESSSVRDMQLKVMEGMKIEIREREDFRFTSIRIQTALLNQRLLLILDDVWEAIDLNGIIDHWDVIMPRLNSKVVITTASEEVCREMKIQQKLRGDWNSLSEDEAWGLFCQEATDLANSTYLRDFLSRGTETVIQCFSYYFLCPFSNILKMPFYWKSEGFFSGVENYLDLASISSTLAVELAKRGLLASSGNSDITAKPGVRDKLYPIQNKRSSFSLPSSPSSSCVKRILVRSSLGLEKAPNVDEWEQGDIERISLVDNKIQTLVDDTVHPPKCPYLSTLFLSSNPLKRISDNFFQHMQGLRVLNLSATSISSLPSSLSYLTNLRLLALRDCPNLETLPLPLIRTMEKLVVLDLQASALLKLTEASFQSMPNLWYLDIRNAANLVQLSLKGCRFFELLFAPENLELLDLTSTKIQDFSHLTNIKNLKRLDILDTNHLTSVRWHEIHHLPERLNWDQCSLESPQGEQFQVTQGYCISVTDDKIFLHLSKNSVLWEKYFRRFKFSILFCDRRRRQPKDRCEPFKRNQFIYRKIYNEKTKCSVGFTRCYDKCLEINGGHNTPYGISGVLYHAEFLSLSNDFITVLSHLGVENMVNLKDCRIERCPRLQSLITTGTRRGNVKALENLEYIWIFNLANLKSLCNGMLGPGSFSSLKRIYLDSFRRLSSLFFSGVRFEKLEALEIRCCGKLEKLFEQDDVLGQNVFPQLKELCLWKLVKFKSICDGDLPSLEKLQIRGCPMLQKLPLCVVSDDNSNATVHAVEIGSELEWLNNLKWEDQSIYRRVRLKALRSYKIK